jgi:ABC-type sugar transport system substrate-binding protein
VQPADWDSNKAATVTEDFLTRFPDVDGIFSLDGSMTPGVLRTVADVGYEGPVVGLGGTATELAALKAGTLWGTTCMSTAKNADAAMDVLEAIASDETFEKTQAVISPPVTKENADTCPGDW